MKRNILFILSFSLSQTIWAQRTSRLFEVYFSNPDAMINDKVDGGYHFKVNDTLTVYMTDDGYYTLKHKNGYVLEEGDTNEEDDRFTRHGKWKAYYDNGKPFTVGHYYKNRPYGNWTLYNEKGELYATYTIQVVQCENGKEAYCKSSETIYKKDKIVEERFYKAIPVMAEDKIEVMDPNTKQVRIKSVPVKSFESKPFGTWIYYNDAGIEERRVDQK
jgi:hypothetical protein